MDDHLQAGIAIYNAGEFHAAHDAWEDVWLDLDAGSDDERLLHGLIQFTAAVHHATRQNWEGVAGLVESAGEYLSGLPADYRGVNVGPVRDYLTTLARDPTAIDFDAPLALTYEGRELHVHHLDFPAAAIAALVLAEEHDYDEAVVAQAVAYARDDLAENNQTSQFITFVMDFASDPAHRGIVFQRLAQHVERRKSKERDVEGLFD
ncbi:DUF309 domain-containing protein [Haladaptatus sp. YSMS36]|uniref:DUF309 domain-containing protein n=1 Tax=Haladaptatus sp. YSMS36 TaxID=3033384 RepID=UPI0023E7E6B7|nr:DUF309 domain-containing protein [Haladaptatus sp. YSMS36]